MQSHTRSSKRDIKLKNRVGAEVKNAEIASTSEFPSQE